MKKTLLATAVAASMAVTGAQAATVYDQDGKSLDFSGRVGVGVKQDYNGQSDFVNAGSRLKVDASNQFTDNSRVFGHVEWRFDADERTGPYGNGNPGFTEVRHAHVGLENSQFGTVMAGNFDNVYTSNVFGAFDYYAMSSGYGFTGMGTNGRGDAVAYMTPDLEGFQVFAQAKHYSFADLTGDFGIANADSSELLTAGGVSYTTQDGFTIAAGYTEAVDGPEAAITNEFESDIHAGIRMSYDFNDMITGRIGYEDQKITDTEVFGIGGVVAVAPGVNVSADYYNKDVDNGDNRNEFALGAYYNFAGNADVFTEVHDSDGDQGDDTFFIVGTRYFF